MLDAWCLVLGAWCLVLGAWCLVLGAWCLMLDVVNAMHSTQCNLPLKIFHVSQKLSDGTVIGY